MIQYATIYYENKNKPIVNKPDNKIYGRRAGVDIEYNGKNITTSLADYISSFSYVDVNSGESDTLAINISDINKKWIGAWFPNKGDSLSAKIITDNWEGNNTQKQFNCGKFILDDISFGGWPISGSIGGISAPANADFKDTKRTKTWENTTLREIAKRIAYRAGVNMYYEDSADITIKSIEQNDKPDSEFLLELCKDYGMAIKIYSNRITLFKEEVYEQKTAKCTINAEELQSWDYNTTLTGTYTGGSIKYTDPNTKKDISVTIGTGPRILEVNEKCDSYADAKKKIINKVNEENKTITTLNVTIMAKYGLIASDCVNIKGLNKIDGKYYIEKITHTIGSKYTMQLEMRKVIDRIT